MSAAWVCFECREKVGQNARYSAEPILCPKCKRKTTFLSHKVPVPKKRDAKAWQQLWQDINTGKLESAQAVQAWKVGRIHEIEKEINALQAEPSRKDRDKEIRRLRNYIAFIKWGKEAYGSQK